METMRMFPDHTTTPPKRGSRGSGDRTVRRDRRAARQMSGLALPTRCRYGVGSACATSGSTPDTGPSCRGTFPKMNEKHLNRYVREFAGKRDLRDLDALDIMGAAVLGMDGKQLECDSPATPRGLDSGARS